VKAFKFIGVSASFGLVSLIAGFGVSSAFANHLNVSCTLQSKGGTCDHIVTLSTSTGPGIVTTKLDSPAWRAGDRVCLKAGNYPYGRLQVWGVTGSSTAPIQIINCGGQVIIGNSKDANGDGKVDSSRGIEINRARYLKISGTGSANHTYGIKLAGTIPGIASLSFSDLSSDMEAEFLEITRSGFSGIMAKTDPGCTDTNPLSFRGGFVQRNASFHDNYIHDLDGGEGFYIGYSFFQGNNLKACPTKKVYAHPVVGTKVYRNRLENTACEAIQIGMGENSLVYDNYIRGYGMDPFAVYQNNGIQIGGGTSGKFYNNFIAKNTSSPTGAGIIIMNRKDTLVYGNTLVAGGIYIHNKASQNYDGSWSGSTLRLVNNTIIASNASAENRGIWNANSVMKTHLLNNLILIANPVASTGMSGDEHVLVNAIHDGAISLGDRQRGLFGPNLYVRDNHRGLFTEERAGHFVNYSAGDFRLKNTSEAVNAGMDVSALGVTVAMDVDHTDKIVEEAPRVVGSSIDIGAFENTNRTPSVTFNPTSLALSEKAVSYFTVSASDADGDAISLSEVSRPSFVTLVSSTANSRKYKVAPVATTVTVQTTFQFKIRASDGKGGVTEKAMNITVRNY
jgi:hypothetical protein